MLLTGDPSFNNKGRRVCLATFNLQSIPAACLLKPTMEEPLKSEDDLQQSRSRLSTTREESLHQASLMAGTRVLGPSDVPCLVKSSTAHGDLLLWFNFSSIGVIKLSGFPSDDSTLAQNPRMSHLPSPKLSAPPQNLPALPFSRRAQIYAVPAKEKLGFPLVGSPNFGPIRLLKPKYNRCNPSLSLQKPRSALKILLSILSLRLCRLSKEIVRRQQLKRKSPLVLWMYTNSIRTLPLDSSRLISHAPKSLKKNGSLVSILKISWIHNEEPDNLIRDPVFFDYALKELGIDLIQRPQPGIMLLSLVLPKPPRTLIYCSWKTSGTNLRTTLLFDLKDPRRPSFPVMERTSAPPSSFKERTQTRLLAAPLEIASASNEAKNPFQTSQNLLIVTISKIPDLFAEVSSTHHDLACGLLLFSFRLRDLMELSSKLYIYLTYVVIACDPTLCTLCSPLLGLFE